MKWRSMFAAAAACILLFSAGAAQAKDDINFDTPVCLEVNDQYIKTDTDPFFYNGTTFVPIRFVSEALGAEDVSWDAGRRTAVIRDGSTVIELPVDTDVGYVNGAQIKIENGIKLVNDRTYVPVRFVSENMGAKVEWDSTTYTVDIFKDGITVPSYLIGKRGYSYDDIYWLSRIIHAESRGEPMEGKIAVGNTVLNRVASSMYPNTIYGVIFDKKHGVQFSPVLDGSIYLTPAGDSVIAAKRALRGENTAGASLFFLNPRIATSSWIIENRPFYKSIGNHDFYL